jgi:hypothetical protein
MLKYYAGIGSRETPVEVLKVMKNTATILMNKGYTLRSGGAHGADSFFESGCWRKDMKEIFDLSSEIPGWAYEEANKHLLFGSIDSMYRTTQKLLARNMMIMLGANGKTPVDFVVCWTKTMNIYDKKVGGTGYGLRLAKERNIPIYNLACESTLNKFHERILDYGDIKPTIRERDINFSR